MMKRLLLLLILLIALVACHNKGLEGKWYLEESEQTGMKIYLEFTEDEMIFYGVRTPFEIRENTLIVKTDNEERSIEFSISGDTLIFKDQEAEQIFIRVE